MSSFTTPLRVELVEDVRGRPILRAGRPQWRLLEPVCYEVGALGSGETIHVPAGTQTDYSSIPRLFWRFEPPGGPSAKAAVVHDWLYVRKGEVSPARRRYTRAQADGIFREALGVLGMAAWKRGLIWAAVRLGGGKGWGS